MKNKIKNNIFYILLTLLILIIPNISNASTTVNDEESLNNAIQSSESGGIIELQNNITVTKPIVITKNLVIEGKGYTIAGSTEWTSTSGNQTMFTVQPTGSILTLKNIDLNNGPKYGVQAYDGGKVILNNVSITGFRYGGILVNGGNVEIIDLSLGFNGTTVNNGIEIDQGVSVSTNPTIVMNGTLTSASKENVIYIANNGYLKDFTVTNAENTTDKIAIAGNKVVITDKYNNVISESNIPSNINGNGDIEKVILTLIGNNKTLKITVNKDSLITEELIKSHFQLDENYKIDGYYSDSNYTNKIDFTNKIDSDKTIYVKISKVEEVVPEKPIEDEKDDVPDTGVNDNLGITVFAILLSILFIGILNRKK